MRIALTAALVALSVGLIGVTTASAAPAGPFSPRSTAGASLLQQVYEGCGYGYCARRICGYYGCRYVCRPCGYHRGGGYGGGGYGGY